MRRNHCGDESCCGPLPTPIDNDQIYNWLNDHIKIEDLKTHPEWKALKQLLGVQE